MKPTQKTVTDSLSLTPNIIKRRIYFIRERQVMLDADLAELYQVATKSLNLSVKRNFERFPSDFIFQLTKLEYQNLRSQFVTSCLRFHIETSNNNRGGRRYLPYVFTEHGVAMLSSVLKSPKAIQMNILIIREFIKMRQILAANSDIEKRLDKIENLQKLHHEVLTIMAQDIKKFKHPPKINAVGFRI